MWPGVDAGGGTEADTALLGAAAGAFGDAARGCVELGDGGDDAAGVDAGVGAGVDAGVGAVGAAVGAGAGVGALGGATSAEAGVDALDLDTMVNATAASGVDAVGDAAVDAVVDVTVESIVDAVCSAAGPVDSGGGVLSVSTSSADEEAAIGLAGA